MLLCIYIKCPSQVSKGASLILDLQDFFEQALLSLIYVVCDFTDINQVSAQYLIFQVEV